jgi:hypothetical protein
MSADNLLKTLIRTFDGFTCDGAPPWTHSEPRLPPNMPRFRKLTRAAVATFFCFLVRSP